MCLVSLKNSSLFALLLWHSSHLFCLQTRLICSQATCHQTAWITTELIDRFILHIYSPTHLTNVLVVIGVRKTAAHKSLIVSSWLIIFSVIFCQSLDIYDLHFCSRSVSLLYPAHDIRWFRCWIIYRRSIRQ